MLLAAARRLALITLGASALIVVVSGLLGLALGVALDRALSLGFYGLGSFLLVAGFFVGNRGPSRVREEGRPTFVFFGERRLRWASPSEQEQTLNESAVFVAVGFLLILIGVAVDSRYQLF